MMATTFGEEFECNRCRRQSAQRVSDRVTEERRSISVTDDESTGDGCIIAVADAQAGFVAISVCGDGQPHSRRLGRHGDAELLHRAWAGGLDHDVGIGENFLQRVPPRRRRQGDLTRALGAIQSLEEKGVTVAETIGALERLHLGDVGACSSEQCPAQRSGPERRQIDHLDALERPNRRWVR